MLCFCMEMEYTDLDMKLMFKFRSGTNDLNEELGRHRGKSNDKQCNLCRMNVRLIHVL